MAKIDIIVNGTRHTIEIDDAAFAQGEYTIEVRREENEPAPVTTAERTRRESCTVSFADLGDAARENRLSEILSTGDELTFALADGRMATLVCGYANGSRARLVFKDCLWKLPMNDTATNKGGYCESQLRQHLLKEIYPMLPDDLKKIIAPRRMIEYHDGVVYEYEDPLWLPSATDVFGPSEDGWWEKEIGSYQLPIFEREVDRVKSDASGETVWWWLRSVNAANTSTFRFVLTSGSRSHTAANTSGGLAPGFDIA